MSYIPTAYYTPEKKFGLGVLVVGLYQAEPDDPSPQPSSLVVNTFASVNQFYGVSLESLTYFNQGQQRLAFDIELHNEAAVYYGVGVDAGSHDANKQELMNSWSR